MDVAAAAQQGRDSGQAGQGRGDGKHHDQTVMERL
jgi:hypothetical protein